MNNAQATRKASEKI